MPEQKIPPNHPYRSDSALRERFDRNNSAPNYSLRRAVALAGIGVVAVGAFLGIRAANTAHEQDALNAELSQPLPNVAADIRDGKINPNDVTRVKIPHTEYAWTAASDLTSPGHEGDTPIVSSIIEAQQGSQVQNGEVVIVPNSEIDPQK